MRCPKESLYNPGIEFQCPFRTGLVNSHLNLARGDGRAGSQHITRLSLMLHPALIPPPLSTAGAAHDTSSLSGACEPTEVCAARSEVSFPPRDRRNSHRPLVLTMPRTSIDECSVWPEIHHLSNSHRPWFPRCQRPQSATARSSQNIPQSEEIPDPAGTTLELAWHPIVFQEARQQ